VLSNLVWLFPAHRELHKRVVFLEGALEQAMRAVQNSAVNIDEALATYNERVLQEIPYDGGKVPDDAWLTPGDNR
jgi:hypothetical protein